MRSEPQVEEIICVILSGGLSSRMKTHKALLKFSDEKNFLQHIIEEYKKAGIKKIIVVKNIDIPIIDTETDNNTVVYINNTRPDKGRLYSLQLGLNEQPEASYCFIQNIDNPLITAGLIMKLQELRAKADYISPEYNSIGGHPVLISSGIIKRILELKTFENTLRDILKPFNRYKLITDDKNCVININFPSEYEDFILGVKKTKAIL